METIRTHWKGIVYSLIIGGLLGCFIGAFTESHTDSSWKILVDGKPDPYAWDDNHVQGGKMYATTFIDKETGKEYIIVTSPSGMVAIPRK